MLSAFMMATTAAGALAMVSAGFGVFMARLVWSEDLVQARQIDEIRSGTETSLRARIAIMERSRDSLRSAAGDE